MDQRNSTSSLSQMTISPLPKVHNRAQHRIGPHSLISVLCSGSRESGRVNRFADFVILTPSPNRLLLLVCPASVRPTSPRRHGRLGHLGESADAHIWTSDQSVAGALVNHGVRLANGIGVGIDLIEARRYFKLAADQNLAAAQFNYALCLQNGEGVDKDLKAAAK
jgi:hypothetical protein